MQKAVAYARFSSSNQREESIDAQMRAIEKYAKENDIIIIKDYKDIAKTATTTDRPQFMQMMKDAKSANFDFIIVHKLDRFARDRYDSAIAHHELKRIGIKVISVTEGLDDSPESEMMRAVLEGMNQYYSANLARETMKGLLENAHKGLYNGGRVPFGFDIVDKKYVINEFEAQAVKMIFDMVLAGQSYGQIINALHDNGFKTKAGNDFKKNSIYDILVNDKYIGIYTFNKRASRGKNVKRNSRKTKDESEIIKLPGVLPAIIEKEKFNEVQNILQNRKVLKNRNDVKAKELYVLSGLLYCGNCGSRMNGETRKNNGKLYKYYSCSRLRSGCKQKSIPKAKLEQAVTSGLAWNLFRPELAKEYTDKVNALIKEKRGDLDTQVKVLEKEVKEKDKQVNNLLDAIQNGCEVSIIKPRLNELSEQKENLRAQLDRLALQAKRSLVKPETIKEKLENCLEILENSDLDKKKQLCKQHIKTVTITDNRIKVITLFDCIPGVDKNVYHDGVGDGSRTHMVLTTRPSTVRVCLFRHPDM